MKRSGSRWPAVAVCVLLVILAGCDGVLKPASLKKAAGQLSSAATSLSETISFSLKESAKAVSKVRSEVQKARTSVSSRAQAGRKTPSSTQAKAPSAGAGRGGQPLAPVVPVSTEKPNVSALRAADWGEYGAYFGETAMSGVRVFEYGKSLLNSAEQQVYEQMVKAVSNAQTSCQFELDADITTEQYGKIFNYFWNDHSEIFYLTGTGYQVYSDGRGRRFYRLSFEYSYDAATIEQRYAQMRARVEALLEAARGSLPGGQTGDAEMERAVHDVLIRNCSYDRIAMDNPSGTPADSFTAYGALVKGTAVCDGYARAVKILLSTAGIPALYVTGTGQINESGGGHAWNMVFVPDSSGVCRWYNLDATWDDPVALIGGVYREIGVSYEYFNFAGEPDDPATRRVVTAHILGKYVKFDFSSGSADNSQNYQYMPTAGQTGGLYLNV